MSSKIGRERWLGAGGNVHERAHYARCAQESAMGRMAYADVTANADSFPSGAAGMLAVELVLVPPGANAGSRLEIQFVENMLDVLLHSAWAASEDLANLPVALSADDPLNHFQLARG